MIKCPGEILYEIPGRSLTAGLDQVVIGGTRVAEKQIFSYRAIYELVFLENEGDVSAYRLLSKCLELTVVEQNAAALGLEKLG